MASSPADSRHGFFSTPITRPKSTSPTRPTRPRGPTADMTPDRVPHHRTRTTPSRPRAPTPMISFHHRSLSQNLQVPHAPADLIPGPRPTLAFGPQPSSACGLLDARQAQGRQQDLLSDRPNDRRTTAPAPTRDTPRTPAAVHLRPPTAQVPSPATRAKDPGTDPLSPLSGLPAPGHPDPEPVGLIY